jgi:hypothetical protein
MFAGSMIRVEDLHGSCRNFMESVGDWWKRMGVPESLLQAHGASRSSTTLRRVVTPIEKGGDPWPLHGAPE